MDFKNVYKEHSKPKVYDVWDLRNRKFIFYLTVGGGSVWNVHTYGPWTLV